MNAELIRLKNENIEFTDKILKTITKEALIANAEQVLFYTEALNLLLTETEKFKKDLQYISLESCWNYYNDSYERHEFNINDNISMIELILETASEEKDQLL